MTATPDLYPLSLHDALPICESDEQLRVHRSRRHAPASSGRGRPRSELGPRAAVRAALVRHAGPAAAPRAARSEEHTSELQSRGHLVCRLLLEKKKQKTSTLT